MHEWIERKREMNSGKMTESPFAELKVTRPFGKCAIIILTKSKAIRNSQSPNISPTTIIPSEMSMSPICDGIDGS
jgi:hypothetical protein